MDDAKLREEIIEALSKLPTMVLSTALIYAQNINTYGVSVVEQWTTAVAQADALNRAERVGYARAMERCDSCGYKSQTH